MVGYMQLHRIILVRIFFFTFLLIQAFCVAAQVNTDSLWSVWNNEDQSDSSRLKAIQVLIKQVYLSTDPSFADSLALIQYNFAVECTQKKQMAAAINSRGVAALYLGKYEVSKQFFQESLEIAREIGDKFAEASALNNLALAFYSEGDIDQAIYCFTKKSVITEEIGDDNGSAQTYINLGVLFTSQGNIPKAIDFYHKGLRAYEVLNDSANISIALSNIGSIYYEQNDYENALEYFLKSEEISSAENDLRNASIACNNIGETYTALSHFDKALKFLTKSLQIKEQLGLKKGAGTTYQSLGKMYQKQGDNARAMEYCVQSKNIFEEIGFDEGLANSQILMSELHMSNNNFSKAINSGKIALNIASRSKNIGQIKDASKSLYLSYKEIGQTSKALTMHELYVANRDSLYSEENQKEIIRQEYKANYAKQALADSLDYIRKKQVREWEHQVVLNKEQNKKNFLYAGIVFLILIGFLAFYGYWRKKRANQIISSQKAEVELQKLVLGEKNKKILDSITYAKRIQAAILPPKTILQNSLKDCFVLYKPKDIVAGDFYWMEQKNGKILFAVADCTGHGVPGALVSVVCNNGLNRSVREHGLTDPGKILDKTVEIVIEEFKKSEEVIKDGMDIALCSLENNTLQFAGAYNPLWIIRKNDNSITELKGQKQPIGRFHNIEPFKTATIQLEPGDCVYLFSDGFADQFGGKKGKKIKPSGFKRMLLDISGKDMQEQKSLLNDNFESWRGEIEQIDDVCVMGYRHTG